MTSIVSSFLIRSSRLTVTILTVLWLGAVGCGISMLWKYALTPGRASSPLSEWPVESKLQLAKDRSTLLVFVHPQCPCTRATIQELAVVMASCPGAVEAQVVIYKPIDSESTWEQTDLCRDAGEIPGVTVISDLGAAEAQQFSVTTSGHALLYSREGKLLFGGGITSSRGHEGENAGRAAIISLLTGGTAEQLKTPVYGCPLYDTPSPSH